MPSTLRALASPGNELTFTAVPRDSGRRDWHRPRWRWLSGSGRIGFGSDPATHSHSPPTAADPGGAKNKSTNSEGRLFHSAVFATDPDIPKQQLSFSLVAVRPPERRRSKAASSPGPRRRTIPSTNLITVYRHRAMARQPERSKETLPARHTVAVPACRMHPRSPPLGLSLFCSPSPARLPHPGQSNLDDRPGPIRPARLLPPEKWSGSPSRPVMDDSTGSAPSP